MGAPLRTLSRIAILASLALAGAARAETPAPDAARLVDRVVAALGGAARLERLTAFRAVGTMEGVSGFPGTYELVARAPDRWRESWDIRYIHQTTAVDGASAWQATAAPHELGGAELERARRDARFNLFFTLAKARTPVSVAPGACGPGRPADLLTFAVPGGPVETFGIDRKTFLPLCELRTETYEEGPIEVRSDFADYRAVKGLMLPFRIEQVRPDNTLKISLDRYELNPPIGHGEFRYPQQDHAADPIDLQLATLPEHIYKEPDGNFSVGPQRFWGMYFYSSESWSLDLMVKERYGRYLEPRHAHLDLYAGGEKVASQDWSRSALLQLRRSPIARFTPQGELYGFRHNLSIPEGVAVDRIAYTLEVTGPDGRPYSRTLDVPITVYRPKTKLIFPMKGHFLVTSGHEFYELEHKYERSQQFAIDIVALGPDFEFAKNDGATMEDYVGYTRRQILAPAAGTVVYARNDVPDGAVKADFLKLKDGLQATAGNLVIIDHGNNEFSVFCHMHQGSVTVKTGDVVRQGQVIGYLGAAGAPGLPHLHYQLQNGPNIFGNDGLPLVFENIERVAWLGRKASGDEHGPASVEQPKSGIFMDAR